MSMFSFLPDEVSSQIPVFIIVSIASLLYQNIKLTWYVYGTVCLKLFALWVGIQHYYHTELTAIDTILFLVSPTLAMIHIIVFEVRDCVLVFIYSVVVSALPLQWTNDMIFVKYLYKYLGDYWSNYERCPICFDEFERIKKTGSNIEVALVCYHKFCERCINQHANGKKEERCPICRAVYCQYGTSHKVKLDEDFKKKLFLDLCGLE
eukprot:1012792_1